MLSLQRNGLNTFNIFPTNVSEGVAAQDIDGGDEHEHACIEYGEMSPLASDVGQHSSFARIAVETQFVLSVAPCPAISVVR